MVFSDVVSPAMTSASPKIHSNILNQYDVTDAKTSKMPTCVASAFSHNDLYKGSAVRDLSESSSPDALTYDTCTPSYQHCVRSPSNESVAKSEPSQDSGSEGPDVRVASVDEESDPSNLGNFAALYNNPLTLLNGYRSLTPNRFAPVGSRRSKCPQQDFAQDEHQDKQNKNNNSNKSKSERRFNTSGANDYAATSPSINKSMHPLKRRVLFGSSPTDEVTNTQSVPDVSQTPPKPRATLSKLPEESLIHSSDILRQMYAAFGGEAGTLQQIGKSGAFDAMRSEGKGSTATNLSPREERDWNARRRSSEVQRSSPSPSHQYPKQGEHASLVTKRTEQRFVKSDETMRYIRDSAKRSSEENLVNLHGKRARNEDSSAKRPNERPRWSQDDSRSRKIAASPLKLNGTAFQMYKRHVSPGKSARDRNSSDTARQAPKRRNDESVSRMFEESDSESRFVDDENARDRRRSTSGDRKSRHASVESSDSAANAPLNSVYGGNNPLGYPYGSPIPLNLAAFGMPGMTMPFGAPGLVQTNPLHAASNSLLLAAQPYLANQYLLREMLNQSSMASTLLPNPAFGLPVVPGMSLEHIQALQHLQNSAMFPSLLGQGFPSLGTQLPGRMFPPASALRKQSRDSTSPPERDDCGASAKASNEVLRNSSRGYSRRSSSPTSDANHLRRPTVLAVRQQAKAERHPKTSERCRSLNGGSQSLPVQHFAPKQSKTTSQIRANRADKKRHDRKAVEKARNKTQDASSKKTKSLSASLPSTPILSEEHPDKDEDATSETFLSNDGASTSQKPSGYKNLTRERRLVANARERTRVHTISSAFDELRAQVPSYSCNQKLSKLAILRIACSYIRTLSVLAGRDESTTFSQGVDQCTKVLQAESRARSRRKSNKAQIEWEMVNYERQKSTEENVKSVASGDTRDNDASKSPSSERSFSVSPPAQDNEITTCTTDTSAVFDDVTEHVDVTWRDDEESCDAALGADVDVETVDESLDDVTSARTMTSPEKLQAKEKPFDCAMTSNVRSPCNEVSTVVPAS